MESQKVVDVVALVLLEGERVLLAKRPEGDALAGKWEFPGGKVEKGETHEQALVREIMEELGVNIKVQEHLATVEHDYENISIRLHAYKGEITGGMIDAKVHASICWFQLKNLFDVGLAPADIPIAKIVCERYLGIR